MRRVLCSLLFLLAAAVPTVFAEEVDEGIATVIAIPYWEMS